MGAGRLVLENPKGEVVRTFSVEGNNVHVIYRHDVRRIEVATPSESAALKEDGISFSIIKKSTVSAIKKSNFALNNGGKLKWVFEVEKTASLVNMPEDSEEQEKAIYKWTALTQVGAMLFVMIVGLLIEPFLFPKPQETIVTVIPQTFVPKQEKVTVEVSEEKIVPTKKVAKKKVISKVKPITKTLTAHVKSPRKENATLRTKVRVENMGALGALGGMKNGSRNSSGFNMNALNDSKGTSWNGVGSGGSGGMERSIHGKGLIASAIGRGGKVEGGGGYGTRGKAGGGRPGYGEMNMGGTAAAYFEPVQEEALIQGGLDKDQIAAVINRHMGEVIYCYEKGLQGNPRLSGRVGMNFNINAAGVVSSASVGRTSLNSAMVEGCIVSHLRQWKFPKPVGGVNVKVSYPFVLKRMSHG